MKKKIWIMNHHATNSFYKKGGRDYWFAENLIKRGYEPTIFCANTRHNCSDVVKIDAKKYGTKITKGIRYVFVKTTRYSGNGLDRIKNMVEFYKNLFAVAKENAKIHGKPDVIIASSVHPLTLVAGIKIAKKFGVQCICEIRDLWPESIVAYGYLKKNSLIAKLLYYGEKWIYKKADKLIFTMEGGKDYIIERGWDKEHGGPIDINKVHHINNGVNLEAYDYNKAHYTIDDEDLNRKDLFKIIYTGSIRKVNNVNSIVEAAKYLNKKMHENIMFLIYGDGTEKEKLEKYCTNNNLQNIKFKGFVEKSKIPYILSKSNLNIMHFDQNGIKKYGASLNKMFEYFASGKPTISDCKFGYDLIEKYNCGIVVDNANAQQLAEKIVEISKLSKEDYDVYCENAMKAANDYDFKILTQKLLDLLFLN